MLKVKFKYIALCAVLSIPGSVIAQGTDRLMTLFTTPQERQVINNNRYKGDKPQQIVKSLPEPEKESNAVQELLKEEVGVTYVVSGVTTNTEGRGTAWINGRSYESGDTMDDGSKVRVKNTTVIITTADGKNHSAISGEVLELTYLRTVEE